MNKFILISLILLCTNIMAQKALLSGTYTLGGNISFSSQTYEGEKKSTNYFYFSPNVGYFLIDKLYSGIGLEYQHYSQSEFSINIYGVGPVLRYFFSNKDLAPFIGFEYYYNNVTSGNYGDEDSGTIITLSGGADFFINEYVALEGIANYRFISNKHSSNMSQYKENSRIFYVGIGVKYFII
ncbi:MAG: outer membrane beta-barrel protein [Ignavibacteriae bacterium]|nr:outer membrane beta-barrel protein [Ignavibacteriota bacterium]MCB9211343.1 outer membrane beta-barrel protein [Ignavibacteriales bacterium]